MNKNKFLKNSIIYFFGNVMTKILTFLLIPIYTNYLSTEAYGYYDLTVSIVTLIVPILFFQIWDGMFRFIYDYKKQEDKQKIVTNGMVVALIGIVLYGLTILITQLFVNVDYKLSIFLYGVMLGMQYIYGTIARTYERNKLYMVTGIISTIINLTSNIILITVFNFGIQSLYISNILGILVQAIIIESKLKPIKQIKIKDISKETIKSMVKFSIPVAITTISVWLLTGYARVRITSFLGISQNGIFGIAMRFSTVITLLISVLQMSWQEISFSVANNEGKKEFYKNGLNKFYTMIVCVSILIISGTQVMFDYLVGEKYMEAFYIMPLIYLFTACNSYASFLATQFWAEKNSKITSMTVLVSAVVNIILIQLLIGKFGLLGVTISLFISAIISMILRMILLEKKYKISINKKHILLSVIVIGIYIFLYYTNNKIINICAILVGILGALLIFKNDIVQIGSKLLKTVKEKA